jgi:hypothetical protein
VENGEKRIKIEILMSMYDGGDDLRVNLIIMSVFFMINFKKLIKEIDKMIIDGLIMMNN